MAYDYDVHFVTGPEIGHVDAISRLRFKDDENDLVATVTATFEIPVININFLEKKLATDYLNKRILEKLRTGKWRNNKIGKEIHRKSQCLDNSK